MRDPAQNRHFVSCLPRWDGQYGFPKVVREMCWVTSSLMIFFNSFQETNKFLIYEVELCEKYNMQIRFLTLGQSDIALHFKQKANVPLYPKLTKIELGTCATEWPEDKKHYMKEFKQDLASWLNLIPWSSTDLLSTENPSRSRKILRFILIWYGLQP